MKRLIVCMDGTWNRPDQRDRGKRKPTNVVLISRAILPLAPDGQHQVIYYDEGVGTHWGLDRVTGGAFGQGISKNIRDAYRFLVNNYSAGEELFFFGFSRGAFTVRSLAGFIRKCGLLPKDHAFFIEDAYQLYHRADVEPDSPVAAKFIEDHHSRIVRIKFAGVWDTVGSLGIPVGIFRILTRHLYQFHDVTLSRYIENAYQALAIDEKRKHYSPCLWEAQNIPGQKLEQVWFAGVHTNIGGGYQDGGLSNVALHWMKNRAEEHGLAFDQEFLSHWHPNPMGELRDSMTLLFRFLGKRVRDIGSTANSNESVHRSAINRLNADPPPRDGPYRPPNLVEYLQRTKGGE